MKQVEINRVFLIPVEDEVSINMGVTVFSSDNPDIRATLQLTELELGPEIEQKAKDFLVTVRKKTESICIGARGLHYGEKL